MKKHNKPILRKYRKDLRQHLTPAEAYLWKNLQNKKLEGRKFRRQHSIHYYIVDFYCASEKLIIELDGEVHNNAVAQEKDYIRDSHLNELGFTVLRFENKRVFDHLDAVLNEIKAHFKSQ